jgi:hypothetical protein
MTDIGFERAWGSLLKIWNSDEVRRGGKLRVSGLNRNGARDRHNNFVSRVLTKNAPASSMELPMRLGNRFIQSRDKSNVKDI